MAMTEEEILAGFAATIEEFAGAPANEVTLGADLSDDLDIDSLSMVQIVISIQDKFSVEIPDQELKDLKTVQDVVSYVQRGQRSGVSS